MCVCTYKKGAKTVRKLKSDIINHIPVRPYRRIFNKDGYTINTRMKRLLSCMVDKITFFHTEFIERKKEISIKSYFLNIPLTSIDRLKAMRS